MGINWDLIIKIDVIVISIVGAITLFELARAILWEIEDIINNYKGRSKEDVHGEDWRGHGTCR